VVIGFAGGEIEKLALNRVLLKNIAIVGLHWGRYAVMENETVHSTWKGIFEMMNKGQIKGITYTDKKYVGLDSLPAALTALGGRDSWGKVVITIPEDEEKIQSKL
jgi:NADPH:quinone reductase